MNISDEMLRESAEKAAEIYLHKLDERFENEPEHVFTKEHDKRIHKMIREQGQTLVKHRFTNFVQKAAVVLLFVLAGILAVTIYIEKRNYEAFIISNPNSIGYNIGDVEFCNVDLQKTVFGYLPIGYEIDEQRIIGDEANYTLKNSSGETLSVKINVVKEKMLGGISLDTENARVKRIIVKGKEAVLSFKTEETTLVCSDRNVICVLSGESISEEEIKKISENIVFFFEEDD